MPFPVGALLGTVGGILGGLGQRKQERRNIRDQTAANKELAEYAYSKDLEQWERQNQYNLPTSQMARLKDAGLNPHLVYGSGSAAGVTSASNSPKYQNVKTDFSQRQSPLSSLNMLGMYQDFKMKNAQIDLVRAEADAGRTYYLNRANEQAYDTELKGTRAAFLGGKKYYGPDGKELTSQKYGQLHKYQLQTKQQQARGYQLGADLKAIELEWLEIMKKAGIGKAFLLPMMRMLMGR